MANRDEPRGFQLVGRIGGGEPHVQWYNVTASAAVYPGQVVKAVAGGTVEDAAANDADIVAGICQGYCGATDTKRGVPVCIDPYAIYRVQYTTGQTPSFPADCFASGDHIDGAGATYAVDDPDHANLCGYSTDELGAVAGADNQFKVIGYSPEPFNDPASEHAKILVTPNQHIWRRGVTGV